MNYITLDGKNFNAGTPRDLVKKLRAASIFGSESVESYMRETAARCLKYNGSVVRTSSAEEFLEDLLRGGFLLPVDEDGHRAPSQ